MHRHEGHLRRVILLGIVLIGEQRHIAEEVSEHHLLVALLLSRAQEVVHTIHQFLHILLSADTLNGAVLHEVCHDASLLHHHTAQFIGIYLVGLRHEAAHEVVETSQLAQRSPVDSEVVCCGVANHGPQAHSMIRSRRHDLTHGSVTDASCGIVDDTLEGLLIVRVHRQAEVRYHILHLLALVERQSAIDTVGNTILAQRLLEDTRLRIGAV